MTMYGKPKGKDANVGNEASERQHGMSKTEMASLMRQFTGRGNAVPHSMPAPLLPNAPKGGRRRGV